MNVGKNCKECAYAHAERLQKTDINWILLQCDVFANTPEHEETPCMEKMETGAGSVTRMVEGKRGKKNDASGGTYHSSPYDTKFHNNSK